MITPLGNDIEVVKHGRKRASYFFTSSKVAVSAVKKHAHPVASTSREPVTKVNKINRNQ